MYLFICHGAVVKIDPVPVGIDTKCIRKTSNDVCNVPRSTIYDKVNEKSTIDCRSGPNTTLSVEEEKRLADWLIDMSRIGYGRSKQAHLDVVQKIIKADGRPTRF